MIRIAVTLCAVLALAGCDTASPILDGETREVGVWGYIDDEGDDEATEGPSPGDLPAPLPHVRSG